MTQPLYPIKIFTSDKELIDQMRESSWPWMALNEAEIIEALVMWASLLTDEFVLFMEKKHNTAKLPELSVEEFQLIFMHEFMHKKIREYNRRSTIHDSHKSSWQHYQLPSYESKRSLISKYEKREMSKWRSW